MKSAVLNNEKNISIAVQYLIYVALIVFCNAYLGLFNLAHAGDFVGDFMFANTGDIALTADIDPNAPLKNIMDQIGTDFKAIAQSFTDLSQSDANAAHADELVDLFSLALQRVPDAISKLPQASQAAAVQDYQSQIKNVISLCQQLAVALQAKDTNTVTQILNELKAAMQKGHGEFNPQPGD